MEESRIITFLIQLTGNASYIIHRSRCQEERLDKHRYAGKHGGHTINTLASIAEAMLPNETFRNQGIEEWGITFILIQCTNIFTTEALDNHHHHILLAEWDAVRGKLTDRRIDLVQLSFLKVVGDDKYILADGTNQRERSVQDQCRIFRTVYVLVGIADGDRAHGFRKASPHPSDTQRDEQQQGQNLDTVILHPRLDSYHLLRHDIKLAKSDNQDDCQQDQIPMVQQFHSKYTSQISFVTELAEDGCRGASSRVLEIDSIRQIDADGQGIDYHKHPLCQLLPTCPFLVMKRKKHQYHVEGVGVHDGRCVEHPSTFQYLSNAIGRKVSAQDAPILHSVCQSAQEIGQVSPHQVDEGRQTCRIYRWSDFHIFFSNRLSFTQIIVSRLQDDLSPVHAFLANRRFFVGHLIRLNVVSTHPGTVSESKHTP